MAKTSFIEKQQLKFGALELVIVLLVAAILIVLALPRFISSKRTAPDFSVVSRQMATALREARQEAIMRRQPVTFLYNDDLKNILLFGGEFGDAGAAENRVFTISDSAAAATLTYGRPPNAAAIVLSDGSNAAPLANDQVKITFQSDGSVVDAGGKPQSKALFFYSSKAPDQSAFAVSVLGAGGRIKTWKYEREANSYVE